MSSNLPRRSAADNDQAIPIECFFLHFAIGHQQVESGKTHRVGTDTRLLFGAVFARLAVPGLLLELLLVFY